jgi:amidase
MAKADESQRGALDQTVELLRSLGHEVVERDPDYGGAVFGLIARYLRGTYDEANGMPHPERLERRTRGYVRMGAAVTPMLLDRALAAEPEHRDRIARSLEGFDLLLTPMFTRLPPRVGEYEGRPALWCFNGEARWTPYAAVWNHTGQPAIAVPAGFTPDGFPLAVQFVAPPDSEPVLLSLAAQLEAERPWADRRPPVA